MMCLHSPNEDSEDTAFIGAREEARCAVARAEPLPPLDPSLARVALLCATFLSGKFGVPLARMIAPAMNNRRVCGTAFGASPNHRATFYANLAESTSTDDATFNEAYTAAGAGRAFVAMATTLHPKGMYTAASRAPDPSQESAVGELLDGVLTEDEIACMLCDGLGNHTHLIRKIVDGLLERMRSATAA